MRKKKINRMQTVDTFTINSFTFIQLKSKLKDAKKHQELLYFQWLLEGNIQSDSG